MPFVSQSQRAYFYANPKMHKYIPEWESATPKGVKLPYKAGRPQSNLEKLARTLAGRKR